jgi:hypothetical protein
LLSRSELIERLSNEESALIEALDIVADKHGISQQTVDRLSRNVVKIVLDELTRTAVEELSAGEDFTVPGIVKVQWYYRPPQKRGERWKKGEERTGFGGVTSVAEEDSPPVARRIILKASPTAGVYKIKPKTSPESQKAFFATKAAKAIIRRKAA